MDYKHCILSKIDLIRLIRGTFLPLLGIDIDLRESKTIVDAYVRVVGEDNIPSMRNGHDLKLFFSFAKEAATLMNII